MAKIRKSIPSKLESELLYKSHHMCSICNIERKGVHIHHIDGDTENYSDDNLIVLCIDCHDQVEKEGKLGRKFKKAELLKYRNDWEEKVKQRYHPEKKNEIQHADIKQVGDMIIQHIQEYDFGKKITEQQSFFKSTETKFNPSTKLLCDVAKKYYEKGDFTESINLSKEIGKIHPELLPFSLEISAVCYNALKDKKNAIKSIEEMLRVIPDPSRIPHEEIASIYLNYGYYEKAEYHSRKFLEVHPNDQSGNILLGHILEHMKKYGDSIKYYKKALENDPNDAHALGHIVDVYDKTDDLQNALKYSSIIIKSEPKNTRAIRKHGILLCVMNNHLNALKQFKKALVLDKNDSALKFSMALELSHLKKHKESTKILDELIKSNPKDILSLKLKGISKCDLGKHDQALKIFKTALNIEPQNFDILYSAGLEFDHLKKYKMALDYYNKSLELNPNHVSSMINKAVILYIDKKNPKHAFLLLKKALKIEPSHPIALQIILFVMAELRQYEILTKNLEKFSATNPTSKFIPLLKLIAESKGNKQKINDSLTDSMKKELAQIIKEIPTFKKCVK